MSCASHNSWNGLQRSLKIINDINNSTYHASVLQDLQYVTNRLKQNDLLIADNLEESLNDTSLFSKILDLEVCTH